MKIKITKTSDLSYERLAEIETIEDLLKIGDRLVVESPSKWGKKGEFEGIKAVVEIYDGWRE